MSIRSQVGIEFLTIIMFLFVVFITFYIGVNSYRLDMIRNEKTFLTRDMALRIHGEIFVAFRAKEGYTRNFSLPPTLLGSNAYAYNATVINNTLIVTTDASEVDYPVPIAEANLSIGGINTIKKNEGGVYLN